MNVLRVTNKVALPHSAVVGLQFVIAIFPDHTHLLFARSQVMVKRGLQYNPIYWFNHTLIILKVLKVYFIYS